MKRNKLFISLVLIQLFLFNDSFAQVNSVSQLPANLRNGLVAFYPFNGNAGDSSGNGNHGTVNGATNTNNRNNQINSAYSFNGSNNYIAVSPSISNSSLINNASFSCWLYSLNYNNYIVCKSNSTIGDYRIFTSSSFARLVINGKEYSVDYNFPLNQWFHFVVTFSNGLFKLYVNGSFIASTNNPFTTYPERNISTNFEIGRDPWGLSEFHYGKIDDLLIYNRELSSSEITQLYTGSFCQPGQGITINPLQDTIRVCGTSTQLNAGSGFSSYAWNTGATTQSISPTQSGFYKVTVTNNNGCSASDSTYLSLVKAKIIQRDTTICKGASITLSVDSTINGSSNTSLPANLRNGLVAYYPFNGNANDESGNGNNGTIHGGVTNTTDRLGNSNRALFFDGNDGYISVSKLDNLKYSPITYSAWVIVNSYFPSSFGHKFRAVIGRNTAYVLDNGVIGLFAANNVNNGINDNTFLMWRGGWTGNEIPTSKINPDLNKWIHIVYTQEFDGTWKWYQNGILTNSGTFNQPQGDYNFFQIGGCNNQSNSNTFWNDKLDDIGVWNRVLTQNEVKTLYNQNDKYWSNGATSNSVTVTPTQTTKYFVTVSDGITSCKDSITVTVNDPTGFNPLSDTVRVCGDSVILDAGAGLSSYLWNTGATTRTIAAKSGGKYNVSVRNAAGCISADSSYVSLVKAKIIQRDTTICKGTSLELSVPTNNLGTLTTGNWQLVSAGDCYKLVTGPSGKLFIPRRTDLLKSIDNGVTWSNANWPLGIVRSGTSLRTGSIYNSVTNQFIQCALDNGYWISNDDGASFTQTGPSGFGTGGVELLHLANGRVIATMAGFPRGVYKSNDLSNTTWTNRYSGVDPNDFVSFGDSIIFSATSNNILKSIDQGDSWSPVLSSSLSDVEKIKDSLFWINSTGNVYVSHLQNVNASVVSRSNLGAGYFDAKYDPTTKYIVAAKSTGIFFSNDHGFTWTTYTIPGASEYYDVTMYQGKVYVGTNVGLFSSSLQNLFYSWSTSSNTNSITVTPLQTTKYFVTVSDGITSCRDSITVSVATIDTSLSALDKPLICKLGGTVRLEAGVGSSYKWIRNGTALIGSNTKIYTATQTGFYRVVVSNAQGCSDTSRSIEIVEEPLAKAGIISGPKVVCSPVNKSTFKLSGYLGNIQWQFSTDSLSYSNLGGEVKDSLLLLNLQSKIFLRAFVKSGTCSSDTSAAVSIRYVKQSPAFSISTLAQCLDSNRFVFTNSSTASEGTLSYKWDFGDSTYSYAVSPSMSYRRDGTFKVVLTVNNSFGCSDTVSKVIKVYPTPTRASIALSGKPVICFGDSILLTGGNYATYRWYRNDVELKGDTSKTYKPISSGMYSLRGISKDGCYGAVSDKISLVINPLTSSPIVKDTIYCLGSLAKPLGASISKGHSSLWYKQLTGDTASSTATIPIITALGKTDYYVSQRNDTTGCESPKAKISITVAALPKKPTVKFDGGIFLVDTGHVSYQWIADGKLVSTSSVYFYKPVIAGVYKVKVTNASGCSDTTLAYNLVVTAVNNMGTNPNNKMLKVYPNPSKSRVWVDIGERPLKGSYIKVLDSRGSEVRKIFITQQTTVIEWSGLVSGAYMLEVVSGTSRRTMRVVKE